MKKIIFATAMALCLMVGTTAYAQDQKPATMKERPTPEQIAQRKTERMTEKLTLTEAQAKQIYALNLEQAKAMLAQHDRMKADYKVQAEKMKAILTPVQYDQWKQMQSRHRAHKGGQKGKQGAACNKPCAKKGAGCDKPCGAKPAEAAK